MICFNLLSIRLSQSHDSEHEFSRLIKVTRVIFFSISSFNIEFIKNWVSYFVLICFLWSYHVLITGHGGWQVNLRRSESIRYVVVSVFIKIIHLKYLFWVKLYFYQLSRDLSRLLSHIGSISILFYIFLY